MATLQVRISDKDMKAVRKLFADLGLDLTDAVRAFLKQALIVQGLPFPVRKRLTENGFTPEFEEEVLATEKENDWSPDFDNVEDAIAWLNAPDDSDET